MLYQLLPKEAPRKNKHIIQAISLFVYSNPHWGTSRNKNNTYVQRIIEKVRGKTKREDRVRGRETEKNIKSYGKFPTVFGNVAIVVDYCKEREAMSHTDIIIVGIVCRSDLYSA